MLDSAAINPAMHMRDLEEGDCPLTPTDWPEGSTGLAGLPATSLGALSPATSTAFPATNPTYDPTYETAPIAALVPGPRTAHMAPNTAGAWDTGGAPATPSDYRTPDACVAARGATPGAGADPLTAHDYRVDMPSTASMAHNQGAAPVDAEGSAPMYSTVPDASTSALDTNMPESADPTSSGNVARDGVTPRGATAMQPTSAVVNGPSVMTAKKAFTLTPDFVLLPEDGNVPAADDARQ